MRRSKTLVVCLQFLNRRSSESKVCLHKLCRVSTEEGALGDDRRRLRSNTEQEDNGSFFDEVRETK